MTLEFKLELLAEVVQAIVIGLLIYRKTYKKLPLFFCYNLFLLVLTGASLSLPAHYPINLQLKIFDAAEIIDALFLFCVLVELSMSVLSPIRSKLSSRSVFIVAGAFAVALALIWPFAKPPGFSRLDHLSQIQVHVDVATSALRIVFFVALAGFSQFLSLSWRDRELQLGTGLGFYALVSLTATMLKMNVGTATAEAADTYHRLDQMQVGGYIGALMYWAVCFAQKVRQRQEFTAQMEDFLVSMVGGARLMRVSLRDSSKPEMKPKKRITKDDSSQD